MTPTTLIQNLKEAAERATHGPWQHETHETDQRGTGVIWALRSDWEPGMFTSPNNKVVAEVQYCSDSRKPWRGSKDEEFEANANLIALANPQNILLLLGEIERLQEALKEIVELDGKFGCETVDVARAAIESIGEK